MKTWTGSEIIRLSMEGGALAGVVRKALEALAGGFTAARFEMWQDGRLTVLWMPDLGRALVCRWRYRHLWVNAASAGEAAMRYRRRYRRRCLHRP